MVYSVAETTSSPSVMDPHHQFFNGSTEAVMPPDVLENSTYGFEDHGNTAVITSQSTTSNSSEDSSLPQSRRKKKPRGMPKRPLSAYNLFFQSQRAKILDGNQNGGTICSNKKIGFADLGRMIGKQWKSLNANDRKAYFQLAEKDSERYRKDMDEYNEMKTKRLKEAEEQEIFDLEVKTARSMQQQQHRSQQLHRHDPPPSIMHADCGFASVPSNFAVAPPPPPLSPHHHRRHQLDFPHDEDYIMRSEQRYVDDRHDQRKQASIAESSYDTTSATRSSSAAVLNLPESSHTSSMSAGHPLFPQSPRDEHHYHHHARMSNNDNNPNNSSSNTSPFPVPPGMEMTLNQHGEDRKYRVQYSCYSMSRETAQQFLDSLVPEGAISSTLPFQRSQGG